MARTFTQRFLIHHSLTRVMAVYFDLTYAEIGGPNFEKPMEQDADSILRGGRQRDNHVISRMAQVLLRLRTRPGNENHTVGGCSYPPDALSGCLRSSRVPAYPCLRRSPLQVSAPAYPALQSTPRESVTVLIDMIAFCRLLDTLHPPGVRLDAAIRDAFRIADHVHQLKCRLNVVDACDSDCDGVASVSTIGFRVAREQLGEKTVIHNYGHWGGGITLSWGSSKLRLTLGGRDT
jgi:hypothetical protein